jgi:hypothetical protein
LTPCITKVLGDSTVTDAFCGVFMPAVNVTLPGLSAFKRIKMTWSTGLEKTSRV